MTKLHTYNQPGGFRRLENGFVALRLAVILVLVEGTAIPPPDLGGAVLLGFRV